MLGENEIAAVDEVFNENTEPVEENPSEFSTVSDNDEVTGVVQPGSSWPREAQVDDERNQGVAEYWMLACVTIIEIRV